MAKANYKGIYVKIHLLTEHDIPIIVSCFAAHNWPKPESTFREYYQEQQNGIRLMWLAYDKDQFAGYVTLKWQSHYKPFNDAHIPEIIDLNVLPPFRGKGIGSRLLEIAEHEAAKKSNAVGLGVGLYQDYGAAQQLYIKRGYIPNGRGITYNYQQVVPGSNVQVDDDLVLWLTKPVIS